MRGVLFRRESTELTKPGGIWDDAGKIYPGVGGSSRMQPTMRWNFKPDAEIQFSHLQREDDKYSWKGAQCGWMGFDEISGFTETQFFYMLSRLRTMAKMKPKVRATCNPSPGWVREFLQPWLNKEWDGLGGPAKDGEIRYFIRVNNTIEWVAKDYTNAAGIRPKSITFIRASLDDNPILDKASPDYRSNLWAQDEIERKRLLEGNWDVFDGSFFPEYEEARHAIMPLYLPEEGKRPPGTWRFFGGLDWGHHAPFAFVLLASDPWGRVHLLESVAQAGLENSAQADMVRACLSRWGAPLNTRIAFDPAMRNKPRAVNTPQGVVQGEADIEAFYRAGLTGCVAVDNARLPGWSRIRKWLSATVEVLSRSSIVVITDEDDPEGPRKVPAIALWRGFNADLIRDFSLFQYEKDDGEDMDKKTGNPHLADALRYALTLHVLPPRSDNAVQTGYNIGRRDLATGSVKDQIITRNPQLVIPRKGAEKPGDPATPEYWGIPKNKRREQPYQ